MKKMPKIKGRLPSLVVGLVGQAALAIRPTTPRNAPWTAFKFRDNPSTRFVLSPAKYRRLLECCSN
jgi:hypothetical protein